MIEKITNKALIQLSKCKKLGLCNHKSVLSNYTTLETFLPRGIIHLVRLEKPNILSFAYPLTSLHNKDCPMNIDLFSITLYARIITKEKEELPKPLKEMINKYKTEKTF